MKIIIIGLGLIGGSIAKTLSSAQDFEILAFDSDQNSIKNALKNQSIQSFLNRLLKVNAILNFDDIIFFHHYRSGISLKSYS